MPTLLRHRHFARMFARFGKLFGPGVWAKATIFGLVFGTIFAVTDRIWMLMFAHAAFDARAEVFR